MIPQFDIAGIVGPLLARAPEWLRTDFASKEAAVRMRAEESLTMMIEAALRDEGATQTQSGQDDAA